MKPTPTLQNHLRYDPWTTSSTGHQVADSAVSTAYRTLRQEKLSRQFGEGQGDCTIVTEGGGLQRGTWVEVEVEADHGRKGDANRGSGLGRRQRDIRGMFAVGKGSSASSSSSAKVDVDRGVLLKGTPSSSLPSGNDIHHQHILQEEHSTTATTTTQDPPTTSINSTPSTINNTSENEPNNLPPPPPPPLLTNPTPKEEYPQLFTSITIYINSAPHPLISDHKLKQILTLHGATIALSLSRRVTHIIVGKPNTRPGLGSGGGLAGGKLQREITRAGVRAWKVVFVEWVLESIKAGKRLSEARFAMQMAGKTQRSVLAFAGR